MEEENRFWTQLCREEQRPFAVELDSPEGPDAEKFMAGAAELAAQGAALITIADCPAARPRMDAGLLACKIRRELEVQAMPHLTCRDRNRNAAQALLLGLHAEGVENLLLVTGDPIPPERRRSVKGVYDFVSQSFLSYVRELNESLFPRPFRLFAALNLNAVHFPAELERALEKERAGADGFFTQPVLTERALENLKLARRELKGRLAGGIIPLVNQRNALFMDRNISGICVDPALITLYEGADWERGEELAVEVSAAAARAVRPFIDGYYLMTPFGRVGLMVRIMGRIRQVEQEEEKKTI